MPRMKDGGLSGKQQRFVEEYLVDYSAIRAAIRAGYSKRSATAIGPENLRKPAIQQALLAKRAAVSERTGLTVDYVERNAMELLERCMQHKPVERNGRPVTVETDDGEIRALYAFDSAGARGALDILARRVGFYELDHNQAGAGLIRRLAELSDAQQDALAERLDKYVGSGLGRPLDGGRGDCATH